MISTITKACDFHVWFFLCSFLFFSFHQASWVCYDEVSGYDMVRSGSFVSYACF